MSALLHIFTNPKAAAYVAALFIGRPDLADDLVDICERESRCTPIGPHEIDAWISPHEWAGQTQLGHLDPTCQTKGGRGKWSTRGPWGMSAGTHWYLVPWRCYDPSWFDNTVFAAFMAAMKYEDECWAEDKATGWCKVKHHSRRNNRRRRRRRA